MLSAFECDQDFKIVLKLLDVQKEDLEMVYQIMDEDKSGEVSYVEFAELLYKMKAQNWRTLLTFIKFYVLETRRDIKEEMKIIKNDVLGGLNTLKQADTASLR